MYRRSLLPLLSLITILAAGCGLKRPFEGRPGTLDQQRFNASVHDPYSDADAGPEVVGGRPREFDTPRSEPIRSRAHPSSGTRGWWSSWFGTGQ